MHYGMTTSANLTQVLSTAVADAREKNKKVLLFSVLGLGALWLTMKFITRRQKVAK